jgi:hypothetical protein
MIKKKFLEELAIYIWIPFIIGLVLYIFWELHDVLLCVIALITFSAIYIIVRLYLLHKKWWLLIILLVIIGGSAGYFFASTPSVTLSINGQTLTDSSVSFTEGSVSVNPAPESNGKYNKNTIVTLIASPASGYDWKSWSGTSNDTSNPTTVTMSADKQITVTFEPRFSLIINNQLVIGSIVSFTEGSVLVNPVPGDDGKYAKDTIITLTTSPASGYDWKSWSGTTSDTSNPTSVTMSSNKHVTVTFEPRFSLTINNQLVIDSSVSFTEGSVSVNPAPGTDGRYAKDTIITLTANPASGYGLKSWSGTSSDTSNPTTVTISSDKHVTVTFERRFSLVINKQLVIDYSVSFTEGKVLVNPAPGTDDKYAKDTIVTLTANPASGYRFDHWSGDVSGNDISVTIMMDANKNIKANFIRFYTLTTSVSPTGGGSVSPSGGTYDEGTDVILTAIPASGYIFDHWSGDVSGNDTSVTITMDANKSVIATFIPSAP